MCPCFMFDSPVPCALPVPWFVCPCLVCARRLCLACACAWFDSPVPGVCLACALVPCACGLACACFVFDSPWGWFKWLCPSSVLVLCSTAPVPCSTAPVLGLCLGLLGLRGLCFMFDSPRAWFVCLLVLCLVCVRQPLALCLVRVSLTYPGR